MNEISTLFTYGTTIYKQTKVITHLGPIVVTPTEELKMHGLYTKVTITNTGKSLFHEAN